MSDKTVYVVVTIVNDGERDLFPDVVLITKNELKAARVCRALINHAASGKDTEVKTAKALKRVGVDCTILSDYTNAAYFTREIDGSF